MELMVEGQSSSLSINRLK